MRRQSAGRVFGAIEIQHQAAVGGLGDEQVARATVGFLATGAVGKNEEQPRIIRLGDRMQAVLAAIAFEHRFARDRGRQRRADGGQQGDRPRLGVGHPACAPASTSTGKWSIPRVCAAPAIRVAEPPAVDGAGAHDVELAVADIQAVGLASGFLEHQASVGDQFAARGASTPRAASKRIWASSTVASRPSRGGPEDRLMSLSAAVPTR